MSKPCHSVDLKGMNESAGKYGVSGQPRGVSDPHNYFNIQSLSLHPMHVLCQDNLFLWDLELFDFEKGSALHSDLESYARNYKQKVYSMPT